MDKKVPYMMIKFLLCYPIFYLFFIIWAPNKNFLIIQK